MLQPTRYVKGSFEIPKAPMDFISMDLIGEFPPLVRTVIGMPLR